MAKRRNRSKVHVQFSPFQFIGSGQASIIFMLAATLLLTVSFVRPGVFGGVRNSVSDIISPALAILSEPFRQAAAVTNSVTGLSELRAENTQLREENIRLREWYQTALMLESENQSLHALLNVKPDPTHRFVTARVIGDSGNAFVKSAIVSAGQDDGIKKGEAVLSGDGLVGRIIEAGNSSARVLLLTDVNSRVPVLIEGSRQKAILSGENTDLPVLKYLPADTDIKNGMRIVTSGNGGMFMSGLPVGVVQIGEDGRPYVKPYSDVSRVTHVRIVDYPENPNLIEGKGNLR
ncbi:MAG: rod shape-determining protein MreC [Micavibrio aeruginosavorus]|uniref:Cell shape-determining protein MreC n=1 Tax=Micavibrio aeruginosavorus TaxID=349221 RepID=A0A2W5QBA6_9BACT|nr:MAG: rod shape-determining protein MreC [Micavibrio aeruginosavorus]